MKKMFVLLLLMSTKIFTASSSKDARSYQKPYLCIGATPIDGSLDFFNEEGIKFAQEQIILTLKHTEKETTPTPLLELYQSLANTGIEGACDEERELVRNLFSLLYQYKPEPEIQAKKSIIPFPLALACIMGARAADDRDLEKLAWHKWRRSSIWILKEIAEYSINKDIDDAAQHLNLRTKDRATGLQNLVVASKQKKLLRATLFALLLLSEYHRQLDYESFEPYI
ncbi:hypothetical protein IPF37_04090 [bacterium]|nr:MAG: hypothetical protein IPF37_04090 [bacterium]